MLDMSNLLAHEKGVQLKQMHHHMREGSSSILRRCGDLKVENDKGALLQ